MSIFEKKDKINWKEFRNFLWKDRGTIPDSSKRFNRAERMAFRDEIFGRKRYMSKQDYGKVVERLEQKSRKIESLPKRKQAEEKVNYLRRAAGIEK